MASRRAAIAGWAAAGLAVLAPGGRADGAASPTSRPGAPKAYVMSEERRIELEVRKAERGELVRPAPKDFKPEPLDRKVRLTLVPRDKSIRVKEKFWYRLELQNVGRTPVHFWETPSFLKNGDRYDLGRWDFYVIGPDGKRENMVIGTMAGEMSIKDSHADAVRVPGGESMSDAEIQKFIRRDSARRRADRDLRVDLAPGETLLSRPWRWVDAEERLARKERGETDVTPRPEGTFREFWTTYRFTIPGRYEIRVVYDNLPHHAPGEEEIRRMELRGVPRERQMKLYQRQIKDYLGVIEAPPISIEVRQ